ncbi:MAG: hypothetical protein IH936_13065, partial [Acidobacteria bacterium]|nr:hypothetical protein [Acidobacteriota bacterium]
MNIPSASGRFLSAVTLTLILFATTAGAQDAAKDEAIRHFSGSIGSVTVDGEQWYRLSFRPDIPIGNWGFAFDIELFMDARGNFNDRGWEFGNSTQTLDTFLRKLYYVRYGKPKQDTYVRVGALDNVTLGYGLIMDHYTNALEYPGIKKTGLQFQLKNVGGSNVEIEGIVNNFQDFQEDGGVVGLRVSTRAAGKLELGVTYVVDINQYGGLLDRDGDGYPDVVDAYPNDKDLALDNDGDGVADALDGDDDNDGIYDIDAGSGLPEDTRQALIDVSENFEGFSVDRTVTRRDPFNKRRADSDRFGILGFDARYPLVDSDQMEVVLYGQFAMLIDDDDELSNFEADAQGVARGNRKAEGFGLAAPGVWLGLGPLSGQFEFRHFRKDFDGGYFDNLYELDRVRLDEATGRARSKDALLDRDRSQTGIFGRIGTDLGGVLDASADYQYLAGGDDPKQQVHGSARLAKDLLRNIPRLNRARAYYQKNNIGARLNEDGTDEDGFFESTVDTFYGYEIGMEISVGVSVIWDTRYVFSRGADGILDRGKIMT